MIDPATHGKHFARYTPWLFSIALFSNLVASSELAAQEPPPAPSLRFDSEAAYATGLTPGAEVIWLALSRRLQGGLSRIEHGISRGVADASGQSSLRLGRGVPGISSWVVVDLSSGAWASGSPAPFAPATLTPPTHAFVAGPLGPESRLAHAGRRRLLLLTRPGEGAWHGQRADGAANDLDGRQNGLASWSPKELKEVEGFPPAPARLAVGDLLVLADPDSLGIAVSRMDDAFLGDALMSERR